MNPALKDILVFSMVSSGARQLVVVYDDALTLPDVGVLLVVQLEDALDGDEGRSAQQSPLQAGGRHVVGVQGGAKEGGDRGQEEGAAKRPRHGDGVGDGR